MPDEFLLNSCWIPWIPIGFRMNSCWILIESLLKSYWVPIGFLLNPYWIPIEFIWNSYWIPIEFLLKSFWIPIEFLLNSKRIPVEFQLDSYWILAVPIVYRKTLQYKFSSATLRSTNFVPLASQDEFCTARLHRTNFVPLDFAVQIGYRVFPYHARLRTRPGTPPTANARHPSDIEILLAH